MAYSELIKNFEKVRSYMRDFYVYGFKGREEFNTKSSHTTMSVKDISIVIGYYNDSSFIRRFSSIMSVSPGQYRKAPNKYKIPEND